MTDKDLIQNALVIIQQELNIDSETAWDFINHFRQYRHWKDRKIRIKNFLIEKGE